MKNDRYTDTWIDGWHFKRYYHKMMYDPIHDIPFMKGDVVYFIKDFDGHILIHRDNGPAVSNKYLKMFMQYGIRIFSMEGSELYFSSKLETEVPRNKHFIFKSIYLENKNKE